MTASDRDRPAQRHRHPADRRDAGGDGATPRSATTSTARTRPSARSRSGSPSCSATRRRCSPPTGSMANLLAVRALVGARPGGALRGRAPTSPAPSSAPTAAFTGLTMRTWTAPARPGRPAGDRGDVRPRHGAVLRRRPRRSRSRTPTTSPAERSSRSSDLRALRAYADARRGRASTSTAPGSGTRTSRPASPLAEYGAVADVLAVCLSKGLGAPVGSLMVGSRRRDRRGADLAQAAGRRHAAGRHPRRGRAVRPRPPRRAAGRRPRARPAARRGAAASTRPTVDTNIVVVDRAPTRPAFVAAAQRGGACWSPRSARPRSAWSPTSTSTTRPPTAPPGSSPASDPGAGPPMTPGAVAGLQSHPASTR